MSEKVKAGQIWEDYDSRFRGKHARRFVVVGIEGTKAIVRALGSNRETKIRIDRFKPNSTGYRLVEEKP